MGIGIGVFLLALGAVLAFAVDASVSGIELNVVGWILMIAGAIGVAVGAIAASRHRTGDTVVTERTVR